MAGGDAKTDAFWVVGFFVVLGLIWYLAGGPTHPGATSGPFLRTTEIPTYPETVIIPTQPLAETTSKPSQSKIHLDRGSAPYSIYVNQEYIEIQADQANLAPVNISGWTLTNGPAPGRRFGRVSIPLASRLLTGNHNQVAQDPVVLKPGDRAIVVSGKMPASIPYSVQSFLANKCSGYLEDLPDYQFTPALWSQCPTPAKEANVAQVDKDCYKYISGLGACHAPNLTTDQDGNELVDYRDDLNTSCRRFVAQEYNYQACVGRHYQDADFYGAEWRIFLNQSDELWDENRETISLYNVRGELVDEINY
ncbi:MAG: hypothetical protein HYT48_03140 [Candidatus Vogelbacteria bacterium]|nr:hypothetical protein [Candidatus Vogelbacteria bacterium]